MLNCVIFQARHKRLGSRSARKITFILLATFPTVTCYHFHLPLVTDDFQFIILLSIFISFPFDRSFLKFFELAESEICEEQPEPVMAEYDGEFDYIEIKNENMTVYVAI